MESSMANLREENTRLKHEVGRLVRERDEGISTREKELCRLREELASHISGVGGGSGSDVSALAREPAVLSGAGPSLLLPTNDFASAFLDEYGFAHLE
jgi:hypothetical protein